MVHDPHRILVTAALSVTLVWLGIALLGTILYHQHASTKRADAQAWADRHAADNSPERLTNDQAEAERIERGRG